MDIGKLMCPLLSKKFRNLTPNLCLIGTGSGILAVWAAKAGARRVYAIEYTDMSKHAKEVMKANNVDHIVTVIKGAVEEIELPDEGFDGGQQCIDVIVSEWFVMICEHSFLC